ncbi:hypothetical protein DW228_15640 [Bacteroides fragilis]|uniref:Uncharacterized protein n=1 Tax=Bacteroides fragilis TaxID=817 RepID=A0A396BWC8_BACFG|nr:hypothetical protein DW228_15640 [Bacteroides fragilis]
MCFSHTLFLLRRKLGVNQMKRNKTDSVTKQCYVTYRICLLSRYHSVTNSWHSLNEVELG